MNTSRKVQHSDQPGFNYKMTTSYLSRFFYEGPKAGFVFGITQYVLQWDFRSGCIPVSPGRAFPASKNLTGRFAGIALKTGISQNNDKVFLVYSGHDAPFDFSDFHEKVGYQYQKIRVVHPFHVNNGIDPINQYTPGFLPKDSFQRHGAGHAVRIRIN